jgi:predicted XRE-type DNA-binding protein
MDTALQIRLTAKCRVDALTGCWEWTGARDQRTGVGRISVDNRSAKVPRVALLAWKGLELTPDEFVLHTCDNPACFNPDHLIVGDRQARDEKAKAEGRYWKAGGEENSNVKLSDEQVAEIRERYEAGGVKQTELAADYGISQHHVSEIVRGQARPQAA